MAPAVWTVGHSTRTAAVFLGLLRGAGIDLLVDIRRYPASRRHPHFASAALEEASAGAGISYVHEPDLGGRRPPRKDSPNTAWTNDGFRGYADHMATPEFEAALARVVERSARATLAVMCAEADPSRCHRQLVADALVLRGVPVLHLVGPQDRRRHVLHPAARLEADGHVRYPDPPGQPSLFPRARRPR